MKKLFLGNHDPDRISLEYVFPVGDLVFSTPFGAEQGRYLRIVVEGNREYLSYFDHHASLLLDDERDPKGRWVALTNYLSDESLELIYEPRRDPMTRDYRLRLLVFGLRMDLVRVCNLKLSPTAVVTARIGHVIVLTECAPLPEDIDNGATDLAPHIIIPQEKFNIN